jgi:hypothetical protein
MSGQQKAIINGNVALVVQGNMSLSGQSSIYLAPNAMLTNFIGGSASLSGNGIANGSGNATNLMVIGTGTNINAFSYSGNSDFIGTVYAPYDNANLSGNGKFIGALVANSANISGNYLFVYDEALGSAGGSSSIYRASSWQEVPP